MILFSLKLITLVRIKAAMRYNYFYIIFLLFFLNNIQAQYRFENYARLTSKDGLPSSSVYDFEEDKYGFIWIATNTGLCKFDGSKVIPFVKEEGDSIFLPSDHIRSLLIKGDSLWIGTRKGLSIFNMNTRQFNNHHFKFDHVELEDNLWERNLIRDMFEDRQGNVWLAPTYSGFVKWDKQTHTFTQFPIYPSDTISQAYSLVGQLSIRKMIQDVDHDHIIWGVGQTGIIKLNQETGEVNRILFPSDDEKFTYNINRKICIYQDKAGLIYSGSWTGGLSIYNPKTKEYILVSKTYRSRMPDKILEGHLYSIFPGEGDKIYLTYGEGVYLFDTKKRTFSIIKESVFKGEIIQYGIDFVDSEDRVWYGNQRGAYIADPIAQQFRWHSLAELNPTDYPLLPRAMVEDFYPGYLSIAGQYADGVYHINPTTGHKFKSKIKEQIEEGSHFQFWGLTQLDKNTLLVSEVKRLYKISKNKELAVPFEVQPNAKILGYHEVLNDGYGKIWVGTYRDGLFSIDLSNYTEKAYKDILPRLSISSHFKDSKGNIWMTMGRGHLVFGREDNELIIFDHAKDTINTFITPRNYCECPNGEVWLAGEAEGLGLLSVENPKAGIIKKVRLLKENGTNIKATRVACNQKNELWVMSNSGLLKMNRNDWSYKNFSYAYGLKSTSDLFSFLKSGELFIGARDGVYAIDTEKLIINNKVPKPYVVSILTNKGPKNKLEDHLKQEPIYLKPNENVLTIEFSAINHSLANQTKYLYQLEGIDEAWIDPGDKRSFTYSYVPGGDYVFKIRACNNEGIWNESAYELPIHVGTPWYKTGLFWAFVIFSLAGFVYAYYQDRIQRIEKESRLKTEFEKKMANVEMSALRAQMNPHFIFNCLNSIESYIIKSDTKKASQYLNNFSRLIRLILQNSRSNYVNLKDEIESIELYIKMEQMRFRDSFSYEINLAEGMNPENFEIPPMLIQPYIENSIWHGLDHDAKDGKVLIEISKGTDTLICVVEDNGIGRKAAAKIRASKKVKRKSMGMDITAERIEIINKIYDTNNKINIEDLYDSNDNPLGTKVTLHIPL